MEDNGDIPTPLNDSTTHSCLHLPRRNELWTLNSSEESDFENACKGVGPEWFKQAQAVLLQHHKVVLFISAIIFHM